MTGHWLSNTRKLNKHYQSGGISTGTKYYSVDWNDGLFGVTNYPGGAIPVEGYENYKWWAFPRAWRLEGSDEYGRYRFNYNSTSYTNYESYKTSDSNGYGSFNIYTLPEVKMESYNWYDFEWEEDTAHTLYARSSASGTTYSAYEYCVDEDGNDTGLSGKMFSELYRNTALMSFIPKVYHWCYGTTQSSYNYRSDAEVVDWVATRNKYSDIRDMINTGLNISNSILIPENTYLFYNQIEGYDADVDDYATTSASVLYGLGYNYYFPYGGLFVSNGYYGSSRVNNVLKRSYTSADYIVERISWARSNYMRDIWADPSDSYSSVLTDNDYFYSTGYFGVPTPISTGTGYYSYYIGSSFYGNSTSGYNGHGMVLIPYKIYTADKYPILNSYYEKYEED